MASDQQSRGLERLFGHVTDIDRRKCHRVVDMEVLNMSFPRTGTMSVQRALETLGYKCYHSTAWFTNIRDCDMWNEALDAKFFGKGRPFTREDWDQLLGDYSGISADPPASAFPEELISAYPEAKVILVERDIDAWCRSFETAVAKPMWDPVVNFVSMLDPGWMGAVGSTHQKWAKGWMKGTNTKDMMSNAKRVYREHYATVRRITPKERLLEFKLNDGWEPLCEFLDKPVPDLPFPRANDSAAMDEMLGMIMRRACWNFVKGLIKWGVIPSAATAWYFYK